MAKVLVVDDEPNIVLSLEFLMQQAGFDVDTAEDGEGALAKVEESPPDLILLDIRLPHWSGFDLVKLLKNEPGLKDIPVLAITALSMGRDDFLRQGFDGLLSKPIAIPNMLRTIAEFMAPIPSTVH